jgi:uncharacterized protein YeaO (DUF488 family)
LGFLNKHGGADKAAMKIGSCFFYYVMRNRGNNEVAPSKQLLEHYKNRLVHLTAIEAWPTYAEHYMHEILTRHNAIDWMEKRAGEAKIGNILLVCYEKDSAHCHRRLLAEETARRSGVEYKGELPQPHNPSFFLGVKS